MSAPRTGRSAGLATGLLAAALAGAGVAATLATPHGRLLTMAPVVPSLVVLGCFVLAFFWAEIALLHVEIRREASSFSLSGIPVVLGLLFCDLRLLIAARLAGALIVFVYQRMSLLKITYNLSAYLFEAAIAGLALHAALGGRFGGVHLDLVTAGLCLLVMAGVDLSMSSLVLLVIALNTQRWGGISLRQAVQAYLPGAALGALSTTIAITIVALLDEGAAGFVLVGLLGVVLALLYRGYLKLRRQHRSLSVMHDFVQEGVGAVAVEALAEALLERIRRMLRASQVSLEFIGDGDDIHLVIDEDDAFTTRIAPRAERPGDWLLTRVRESGESILIARHTKDRGLRHWLATRAVRDAMLVPLPSSEFSGLLVITDRLGETSTFTPEDLTLVQTLAGHLVIALRGAKLVDQLRHDATHDALTGLANRFLLSERIGSVLEPVAGPDLPADDDELAEVAAERRVGPGVLLLDLDKFKEVNDALGHHVGDALLQVVGSRIQSCAPEGATVARLGGDEFAVLLPAADRREAIRAAHAVQTALSSPITLPDVVVSTRASIGIAMATPGMIGADLLRHADTAMYAAKAGLEPVVIYTSDLDRGRAERLTLLADLHLALDRDELELSYQPQLDLHTGAIVSVEALVRWRHPTDGLLSPDQFIPLAESSGLIDELTRQVLRKALAQCRQWRDIGLDLVVAVNLSADTVNNVNLPEDVAAALAEAGLPADRLVLEITESILMGDPSRTVPILQRLSDIGVTISLDDFGTGYSSLSYLQKLPVSEVKIDRSFVTGLLPAPGEPSNDAAASAVLVRSILSLGASLGLRVVAEGVEDRQALDLLRELGCDLAQGYFISRPMQPHEVTATLTGPSRHLSALAS